MTAFLFVESTIAKRFGPSKGETLASQMLVSDPSGEAHAAEAPLGRERVRIGLTRVGSLLDTR